MNGSLKLASRVLAVLLTSLAALQPAAAQPAAAQPAAAQPAAAQPAAAQPAAAPPAPAGQPGTPSGQPGGASHGASSMMMMASSPMRAAPAVGAQVYIISPKSGTRVKGPVTVRFGLKGMGVAPSSCAVENTGHHHLLIDTDLKTLNLDQPLPATEKVMHFGKGQTETTLTLAPGKHTLELVFADSKHLSFDPALHSEKISITVE
jgi:pyruvate/2-oxoglutarate dehydrogenase complex dihydrolipoamide acyltransferase (E2) component